MKLCHRIMRVKGLPEIEGGSWLHALDDATLLLELVSALEAPEPEWLPLSKDDASEGVECRFESPMTFTQAIEAVDTLKHCAIQLAVLQACLVLESMCDSFDGPVRATVCQAIGICQLIRDSYSEHPYGPVWCLAPGQDRASFNVPDVISLNVAGLGGQPVNILDYGGSGAVLRLLEFTRELLDRPDSR